MVDVGDDSAIMEHEGTVSVKSDEMASGPLAPATAVLLSEGDTDKDQDVSPLVAETVALPSEEFKSKSDDHSAILAESEHRSQKNQEESEHDAPASRQDNQHESDVNGEMPSVAVRSTRALAMPPELSQSQRLAIPMEISAVPVAQSSDQQETFSQIFSCGNDDDAPDLSHTETLRSMAGERSIDRGGIITRSSSFGRQSREARNERASAARASSRVSQPELEAFLRSRFGTVAKGAKEARLDVQMQHTRDLMSSASISDVLQLSINAAACKPLIRAVLFVLGAILLFWFGCAMFAIRNHRVAVLHLRLTTLELRGADLLLLPGHHVGSFGALYHGCKVSTPSNSTTEGNSLTLSFAEELPVDGWFVSSEAASDPAHDPSQLFVEGSSDGKVWFELPSRAWQLSLLGSVHYLRERKIEMPTQRGEPVTYSLLPWWPWLAELAGAFLVPGLGLLGSSALGSLQHGSKQIRTLLALALSLGAVLHLFAGCAYLALGDSAHSISVIVDAALLTTLVVVLLWHEVVFIPIACVVCFLYPILGLVQFVQFDIDHHVLASHRMLAALVAVPLQTIFSVFRHRQLNIKDKLLQPFRQGFDKAWGHVQIGEGARELLRALSDMSGTANQFVDKRAKLYQQTQAGARIGSLDQLYAQASGMQLLLRRKVLSWAAQNNGLVRTSDRASMADPPPEYCRCEDEEQRDLLGGKEWVRLKQPQRAMEKVVKVLQGDVSRLTDLCRSRIVFERLDDLVACFRSIINDREVFLERIANRMEPAYDGTRKHGFREVNLKVRIDSADSARLGANMHIGEVQLVMRVFDELETGDYHRHYVSWKDAKELYDVWNWGQQLASLLCCNLWAPASRGLNQEPSSFSVAGSWSARLFLGSSAREVASGSARGQALAASVSRTSSMNLSGFSHISSRRHSYAQAREARDRAAAAAASSASSGSENVSEETRFSVFQSMISKLTTDGSSNRNSWLTATRSRGSRASLRGSLRGGRASRSTWSRTGSIRLELPGSRWLMNLFGQEGASATAEEGADEASLTLEERRTKALIVEYLKTVSAPAGQLQQKLNNPNEAILSASSASVLFTSMPVASALCKRWFRVLLLALAALFGAVMVRNASYAARGMTAEWKALRFTALQLRDAPLAAHPGPHIARAGGLLNGCRVEDVAAETVVGNSLVLTYDDKIEMDGWYLVTEEDQTAELDPVRFSIEGSKDGVDFQLLGNSDEWAYLHPHIPRYNEDAYWTTAERGAQEVFDFRLPWQFVCQRVLPQLNGALTLSMVAACGMKHKQFLGKQVLLLGMLVAAALLTTTGVAYQMQGLWKAAMAPFIYAVGNLVLAVLLVRREPWVMQQTLLVGLAAVAVCVAENTLLRNTPWAIVDPRTSFPFAGLFLCMVGVFFPIYRWGVVSRSHSAIEKDQEAYGQAWARLLSDEEDAAGLEELREVVDNLFYYAHRKKVRQGQRYRTPYEGLLARTGSAASEDGSHHSSKRSSRHSRRLLSDFLHLSLRISDLGENSPAPRSPAAPVIPPLSAAEVQSPSIAPLERPSCSRLSMPGASPATLLLDRSLSSRMLERNSSSRSSLMGRTNSAGGALAERASRRFSVGSQSRGTEAAPPPSLDSLYAQAAALRVELENKVRGWGQQCGACVQLRAADDELDRAGSSPSRAGSSGQAPRRLSSGGNSLSGRGTNRNTRVEFVPMEHVANDPRLAARVKRTKLKRTDRAIEKLIRSYQQDLALLTDVCRDSMVFYSVQDLVATLHLIAADGDIQVVRVKNRLDTAYDAKTSAGYRDVALNLQIVTPYTEELGLDTHVCELQLILIRFAELKSEEGHKRYVEFRNARGE